MLNFEDFELDITKEEIGEDLHLNFTVPTDDEFSPVLKVEAPKTLEEELAQKRAVRKDMFEKDTLRREILKRKLLKRKMAHDLKIQKELDSLATKMYDISESFDRTKFTKMQDPRTKSVKTMFVAEIELAKMMVEFERNRKELMEQPSNPSILAGDNLKNLIIENFNRKLNGYTRLNLENFNRLMSDVSNKSAKKAQEKPPFVVGKPKTSFQSAVATPRRVPNPAKKTDLVSRLNSSREARRGMGI